MQSKLLLAALLFAVLAFGACDRVSLRQAAVQIGRYQLVKDGDGRHLFDTATGALYDEAGFNTPYYIWLVRVVPPPQK